MSFEVNYAAVDEQTTNTNNNHANANYSSNNNNNNNSNSTILPSSSFLNKPPKLDLIKREKEAFRKLLLNESNTTIHYSQHNNSNPTSLTNPLRWINDISSSPLTTTTITNPSNLRVVNHNHNKTTMKQRSQSNLSNYNNYSNEQYAYSSPKPSPIKKNRPRTAPITQQHPNTSNNNSDNNGATTSTKKLNNNTKQERIMNITTTKEKRRANSARLRPSTSQSSFRSSFSNNNNNLFSALNNNKSLMDYKKFSKVNFNPNEFNNCNTNNCVNNNVNNNNWGGGMKMKAVSVDIEVRLREKLEYLERMGVTEDVTDEYLRKQYKKVYTDCFNEIIEVSPYGELLQEIKDAYEKDALIADKDEYKKTYDEMTILYTKAQSDAFMLENIIKELQVENSNLKSELRRLKSDNQKFKVELERLTQLKVDIGSKEADVMLANLVNNNSYDNNQSSNSPNSQVFSPRSPRWGLKLRGIVTPREEVSSARKRLYAQDFFDEDEEIKELKERDKMFELESELAKTILKQKEIARELALIKLDREAQGKDSDPNNSNNNNNGGNKDNNNTLTDKSIIEDLVIKQNSTMDLLALGIVNNNEGLLTTTTTATTTGRGTETIRERLLRRARQQDQLEIDASLLSNSMVKKVNHGTAATISANIITSSVEQQQQQQYGIIDMDKLRLSTTNIQSTEPINLTFRSDCSSSDSFVADIEDRTFIESGSRSKKIR
ncbi:hypothetical protein ABK040_009055 [Willaertia magna]